MRIYEYQYEYPERSSSGRMVYIVAFQQGGILLSVPAADTWSAWF